MCVILSLRLCSSPSPDALTLPAAAPLSFPSLPAPRPTHHAAATSFQSLQPTQTFRGHAQIPTALREVSGEPNMFLAGERVGSNADRLIVWGEAGGVPACFSTESCTTHPYHPSIGDKKDCLHAARDCCWPSYTCHLPRTFHLPPGDKEGCMLLWDLRTPTQVGAFGAPAADGRNK